MGKTITDQLKKTSDLIVVHTFDAAIEKVWLVWTEDKFVARWWYIDGFSNILAKMDVRKKGKSHVGMRASKEFGGRDYYNVFQYKEIVPKKLIQYISNFADKDGNVISPKEAGLPIETPMNKQQQVVFEDLGDGKTKVTITEYGWHPDGIMIERSRRGLEQTLSNIDKVLKAL